VVLERRAALNQMVGPPESAHLFTLAGDLERVQVVAQVAEGDVAKVTRGLKATFTVTGAAEGEPALDGKVEEVRLTPASDRGAVFYKVVIEARNEREPRTGEWRLRPGQTVSVDIVRRAHESAWKMPAAAFTFQPDEAVQSEAARARLRQWQSLPHHDQWRTVWVAGADQRPWPLFIRVGGRDGRGEDGIQDGQWTEVLQWDPQLSPAPDPRDPSTWPRPVIGLTPRKSWLSPPQIKL
jgi:HlyD family secretion protein